VLLRRSWTLPVFAGELITALRLELDAERVATEVLEDVVSLLVSLVVREAVTLLPEAVDERTPVEERVPAVVVLLRS
jgi:hypothetical protein